MRIQTDKGPREGKAGGEVYRSDDRGETWRKVNAEDVSNGIGHSFGDIRVSPENADIVYVLGVNLMGSRNG